MKKLSIIIVSWNTREVLGQCLKSIQLHAPEAEVIVVDNASSDGTPDFVAEHYPEVVLVKNDHNAGFAKANNLGASRATTDYLCFLNSDTELQERGLGDLVVYLSSNDSVGAIGPKILLSNGHLQESWGDWPGAAHAFWQFGVRLFARVGLRAGPPEAACSTLSSPFRPDWISGCCLLMERGLFEKVGGWDEQFFAYYEDVVLCRRIMERGLQVAVVPACSILHMHGASYGQVGEAKRILDSFRSCCLYCGTFYSQMRVRSLICGVRAIWRMIWWVLVVLDTFTNGKVEKVTRKRSLVSELLRETGNLNKELM